MRWNSLLQHCSDKNRSIVAMWNNTWMYLDVPGSTWMYLCDLLCTTRMWQETFYLSLLCHLWVTPQPLPLHQETTLALPREACCMCPAPQRELLWGVSRTFPEFCNKDLWRRSIIKWRFQSFSVVFTHLLRNHVEKVGTCSDATCLRWNHRSQYHYWLYVSGNIQSIHVTFRFLHHFWPIPWIKVFG